MRWSVVFFSAVLSLLTFTSQADEALPPLPAAISERVTTPMPAEAFSEKPKAAIELKAANALLTNPIKASYRDPTMPLNYQSVSKTEEAIVLSSILISKYRKVAVLNGVVVNEGSRIKSYEVVSIDKKQVVLKSKRKSMVLLLRKTPAVSVRQAVSGAINSSSIMKNIMQGGR